MDISTQFDLISIFIITIFIIIMGMYSDKPNSLDIVLIGIFTFVFFGLLLLLEEIRDSINSRSQVTQRCVRKKQTKR